MRVLTKQYFVIRARHSKRKKGSLNDKAFPEKNGIVLLPSERELGIQID
jgi:hypothetical protein